MHVATSPGVCPFAATLSLVTPSVIVVCIIANYFQKFKNAKIVKMLFAGLKPAVVAFIVSACLSLFLNTLFDLEASGLQLFDFKCIALFAVLLYVKMKKSKIHPILFIVLAATCGILFKF